MLHMDSVGLENGQLKCSVIHWPPQRIAFFKCCSDSANYLALTTYSLGYGLFKIHLVNRNLFVPVQKLIILPWCVL